MPIVRLHLPGAVEGQERGYVTTSDRLLRPGLLVPDYVVEGAQFRIFEKETITDVTPNFWGEEAENQYILQMKRTPEAGILRTLGWGDLEVIGASLNIEALAIKSLRQIHIPANTEIVPISRQLEGKVIEVGAIVMHATAEELSVMEAIIASPSSLT